MEFFIRHLLDGGVRGHLIPGPLERKRLFPLGGARFDGRATKDGSVIFLAGEYLHDDLSP
jgi:hypothetical protein